VTFYLGSPCSQMQADWCRGMPVLISYAIYPKSRGDKTPWLDDYVTSFARVLIDSGAFSEFISGGRVEGPAYLEWQARWREVVHVDAVAGLDDIGGDWKKSLHNYERYGGFPTFHESDPEWLLDELIPLARERGNWLGVGLLPPRGGKWEFVRRTLARIPDGLHVHLWAGGEYSGHPRVDSVDSTNWFRDGWKLRGLPDTAHLTPAECLEIVVKRYQRAARKPVPKASATATLFD
jgi:hypothetical protein